MDNENYNQPEFDIEMYRHHFILHDRSIQTIIRYLCKVRTKFVLWHCNVYTPERLFEDIEQTLRITEDERLLSGVDFRGIPQHLFFLEGAQKDILEAIFDGICAEIYRFPRQPKHKNVQEVLEGEINLNTENSGDENGPVHLWNGPVKMCKE